MEQKAVSRRLELAVTPELAGIRVDTLLKKHMGLSGTVVRRIKWLEDGILVDGVRVNTRFCPCGCPTRSAAAALSLPRGRWTLYTKTRTSLF